MQKNILALVSAFSLCMQLSGAPFAYVSNWRDNTISIIDMGLQPNQVVTTLNYSVFNQPNGIAFSPDGKYVYITQNGSATLVKIDVLTNNVSSITTVGDLPLQPLVSRDGLYVYVTNADSDTVSVVDALTSTVVHTIPTQDRPNDVILSLDGLRLYVTNFFSNTVSVIDTTTNSVMTNIPVERAPAKMALTLDGKYLYVGNTNFGVAPPGTHPTISVIDTTTLTVVGSPIQTPSHVVPGNMAMTPDGAYIYITSRSPVHTNKVLILSTATNTFLDSVADPLSLLNDPLGIAISADGTTGYVTNYLLQGASVAVIDIASNTVLYTLPVGGQPVKVSISPPIIPTLPTFLRVTSGLGVQRGF